MSGIKFWKTEINGNPPYFHCLNTKKNGNGNFSVFIIGYYIIVE